MDVPESKKTLVKTSPVESSRRQTVLSEKNNETTRRSRTREITSRYMSPTPVPPPRRYPSPGVTRPSTPSVPKRAISAERKRPSNPPSPRQQSTPVQDTFETRKKLSLNRIPEALRPSTMRSLNVSFQSDAFSMSVNKKEKEPLSNLKISKISQKHVEKPFITRKATPEKNISPLKGKNAPNQSENLKSDNVLHARLVEQHMWPGRTGSALARSINLTDKSTSTPSVRKMPLMKSVSVASHLASFKELGNSDFGLFKPVSSRFSKMNVATPGARSRSLPTTPGGSRASSPNRATICTSRGVSPVHSRSTSPSRQMSNCNNSVLTFTANIKRGKKAANHIEDAHELRLLYNRHLQWRFANARANSVLHDQKVKAEKMLYNVCETTSELWDFVTEKRNELQQLRLRLKLHMVLTEQMAYLEAWGICESEHTSYLSHVVEDLRTSILRLPVTAGARGGIQTVKAAVCSAVDVMRAMGSSISSIIKRVEGMNSLVSDLADVAARGKAAIHGCEALLASIEALQVEEYSLRTHLIQMKEN